MARDQDRTAEGGTPPAEGREPDSGSRRSWWATARVGGLRIAAVIEIALFLGAALALDQAVLDADRFWSLAPHPFWLIVILVAAKYGTNEGLVAALASSAALLIGNVPEQTPDQALYPFLLELSYRPMMWLTAAVVLGEIGLNHVRRKRYLEAELDAALVREATLAEAYESLKRNRERLELSIASELRSLASTYDAARQMHSMSVEDVLSGAMRLIKAVVAPRRFSLYGVKDNDTLSVFEHYQWPSKDAYRKRFDRSSSLYAAIVGEQRFLSAADPADQRILGDQGLLAGPVIDPGTGHTIGMIKVEALDFSDLNFTAIQNFMVVCDMVGTAMSNLLRYSKMASRSIFAEGSPLFSQTFYARQTGFLAALGRRVGFPVSTITIKVHRTEDWTAELGEELPRILQDTVAEGLRDTDLAFDYQPDDGEYIVVLPNTPLESTRIVIERLQTALADRLGGTVRLTFDAAALVDSPSPTEQQPSEVRLPPYYLEREFLTALARRLEAPLSAIRIRVQPRRVLSDRAHANIAERVDAALARTLEPDEPVAEADRDEGTRMILLLGADLERARDRAAELEQAIREAFGNLVRALRVETECELLVGPAGDKAEAEGNSPAAVVAPADGPETGADDSPHDGAAPAHVRRIGKSS